MIKIDDEYFLNWDERLKFCNRPVDLEQLVEEPLKQFVERVMDGSTAYLYHPTRGLKTQGVTIDDFLRRCANRSFDLGWGHFYDMPWDTIYIIYETGDQFGYDVQHHYTAFKNFDEYLHWCGTGSAQHDT
jgi:hypothetical protein